MAVSDLPPLPRLDAGPYTLREWAVSDVAAVQEAATDPYIVAVTTVPSPCSTNEALAFVERQWSRLASGAGYSFAVADSTNRTVGQIGLWVRDLDAGRAELGYWTVPSATGRGVATHALGALSDWAQRELRIPRLQLFVEPWNTGSTKTAERCGYQREGLLRSWQEISGERRDLYVYSRII